MSAPNPNARLAEGFVPVDPASDAGSPEIQFEINGPWYLQRPIGWDHDGDVKYSPDICPRCSGVGTLPLIKAPPHKPKQHPRAPGGVSSVEVAGREVIGTGGTIREELPTSGRAREAMLKRAKSSATVPPKIDIGPDVAKIMELGYDELDARAARTKYGSMNAAIDALLQGYTWHGEPSQFTPSSGSSKSGHVSTSLRHMSPTTHAELSRALATTESRLECIEAREALLEEYNRLMKANANNRIYAIVTAFANLGHKVEYRFENKDLKWYCFVYPPNTLVGLSTSGKGSTQQQAKAQALETLINDLVSDGRV